MWKRVAIIFIATWVLFSGYAWPHSRANLVNNWFVGLGLVVFAVLWMWYAWARYFTLGLAVWLFLFSVVVHRTSPVTYWNDAMVALVVFVLSLVSGPKHPVAHEQTA
jgi:hypothetical protein